MPADTAPPPPQEAAAPPPPAEARAATKTSAPGSLPFELLPEPLRGYVEWSQRRHGLTPAATCLATLASVLCACGPSQRIVNPIDLRPRPPAFSVVLLGHPMAYVQAAVEVGLNPIRQWMLGRIGPPDKQQLRRVRLRIGELNQERIAKEAHLNCSAPPAPDVFRQEQQQQELEVLRQKLRGEHARIVRQIADASFLLRPHLLVDDAAMPRLLDPGKLCTDGATLHVSLGGHVVPAWTSANAATKAELARLLNLAWQGLPDAGGEDCHATPLLSNFLAVDAAGAASLWSDAALGTTDVTGHLFFLEATAGGAKLDFSANCPDETSEAWTKGLQAILDGRLAGRTFDHQLDPEATGIFSAYAGELLGQAKESASSEARRLERAPVLALKLAVLIHAMIPGAQKLAVGAKTMEFAHALATAVCADDLQFGNRMRREPADKNEQSPARSEVDALVCKLRLRGPLRWRTLLRARHDQRAEPLLAVLEKAVAAGLVRREGDLFSAIKAT